VLLILGLPAATWAAGKSDAARELAHWAEGPVRWLLLPPEWRALRQVEQQSEVGAFIEAFWARRDPASDGGGNRFRQLFAQRVDAADRLYGEAEVVGSLSDRGRALILLGPPSHVRVAREPVLTWDARRKERRRAATREVNSEIWGYRLEDLPSPLLQALRDSDRKREVALPLTLTFQATSRRTYLVEGETLLDLAARVVCRWCDG
jgi:GWxTD domain-containing protein